ncbi:response regulator [Lichenicoccus sp.]|uniref:response regulator n=1 Tax=Lichenicoccus sp. TaxID=2781899 RepID=UPI003D13611E
MNAPPPPLASRLLLVEDEFLIRMTLSEALAEDGFEVVEAEDADAALERLRHDPDGFALMLTDIQLPGRLDGVALARHARISRPDLPVIFMSGQPETKIAPNPLDTFVGKPYSPTALSATVRRILNGG